MHFTGLIVGIISFLTIGCCHPLVIKVEYMFGKRKWWLFFSAGFVMALVSMLLTNRIASIVVGVVGFSFFWSTNEMFKQHKRVMMGHAKRNPNRSYELLPLLAMPCATNINLDGIVVGTATYLLIALGHHSVIWAEYWFTKRCWPAYLVVGVAAMVGSMFIDELVVSVIISILGTTALWGIGEVIQQEKRVEKGWFPKRKCDK